MTIHILFHGNCPDGFGSAWQMSRYLAGGDVRITSMAYGDPLPDDIDGYVICVDFCPPADQLATLVETSSGLLILDHHQTAVDYVAGVEGLGVWDSVECYMNDNEYAEHMAIIDQTRSGVGLVMEWTGTHERFLMNIEDRDLWHFNFPETAAVFAAVTSHPYTLEAWDRIAELSIEALVAEGEAIERYRQKLIADCVQTARQETVPTGDTVWVAACPYAIGSDVAGVLAQRDPTGYAAYYVDYPGEKVRFGLRSVDPTGADVAKIAETLGGGGHKHAAGFEMSLTALEIHLTGVVS